MSGANERIEREIVVMSEAIANIASELRSTYGGYLAGLGQATRQQLILACYHLCTQGYPESFLKLSYNQRQKMQEGLRQLAIAAAEKLELLVKEKHEAIREKLQEEREGWEDEENHQLPVTPHNLPVTCPLSPETLVEWQENIEKAIANILKNLSRDSNRLLQKSGILPQQLPEPILEAAANADSSGDAIAGPPNVLNLIIETVQSDDEEVLRQLGEIEDLEDSRDLVGLASLRGLPSPNSIHITAINLRLSEIEFADASVTAWRHQIRNLCARLNTLRRDYKKKQRERSIAEAESAWRACWFEQ